MNCRKCNEVLTEISKVKNKRICKDCQNSYSKQYYQKNSEKWVDYDKYKSLSDEEKKEKYKRTKEKQNQEKYLKYQREYREKNKEELKEKRKEYQKNVRYPRHLERMKTDEKYRASRAYRSLLKNFIKRSKVGYVKKEHTIGILGYSLIDFKLYIESLFLPGMTWLNHGEWHLDHIIPISSFEPETPPNVVNALSNLQPL
jgi:hypothetical protein